jgi:hypothetical protein
MDDAEQHSQSASRFEHLASSSVIPKASSKHLQIFPSMPRGPGWTPDDDADLAKSWSRISSDPVIGIDQTASGFWARIAVEYNTLSRRRDAQQRVERSECSIKCRWNSVVRPNCSKFVSALQTIEDIRPTGATEQDKINLAIGLYNGRDPKDRNAGPGEFLQLEAWHVLRKLPKFLGRNSPGNIPALNRFQTGAGLAASAAEEDRGFGTAPDTYTERSEDQQPDESEVNLSLSEGGNYIQNFSAENCISGHSSGDTLRPLGRKASKRAAQSAERESRQLKEVERLAVSNEEYVEEFRLLRAEVEKQGRAKRFAELQSLVESQSNPDYFERVKRIKIARAEELLQLAEKEFDVNSQH